MPLGDASSDDYSDLAGTLSLVEKWIQDVRYTSRNILKALSQVLTIGHIRSFGIGWTCSGSELLTHCVLDITVYTVTDMILNNGNG